MKHYILFYEVVSDHAERRAPHRALHLRRAWEAQERGELVLAGALKDGPVGAALLFRGDSPRVAEAFAEADPYVTEGLVTRWTVSEWVTVVGDQAASPVRPDSA
ncbi:MAG: YciI-like protein [Gemmatimonadota bacterium]